MTVTQRQARSFSRRILQIAGGAEADLEHAARHAVDLGFDTLLAPADIAVEAAAKVAGSAGLALVLDLALDRFDADHPLVLAHPGAFAAASAVGSAAFDPRRIGPAVGARWAYPSWDDKGARGLVADWAQARLAEAMDAGAQGFRILQPQAVPPTVWTACIAFARAQRSGVTFIAETRGVARAATIALAGCGFDALTSSLAWWDGRAAWFVEEYEALRTVAPLISTVSDLGDRWADAQGLRLAAGAGCGLLLCATDALDPSWAEAVRQANALSRELAPFGGEMRRLSGAGAAVTVLLRATTPDARRTSAGLMILANPDRDREAAPVLDGVLAGAGAAFEGFERIGNGGEPFASLAPGEVRLLLARRARPIAHPLPTEATAAQIAAQAPRLVVEGVTPTVEGGPFPVRRVVGETVTVEADIFADGHEQLSAELMWRALDEPGWRSVTMEPLGNDRWRACFPLQRLGRYEFAVEGWLDLFAGFRRDYARKREAGVDQAADAREGLGLVEQAAKRCTGALKAELKAARDRLRATDATALPDLLLTDDLAALMQRADERPFRLRSPAQFVDAEPLSARFSSWYELFPRSQAPQPREGEARRHGTFDDVIARLPGVRAMGFDVLYFPPIHPIGTKNRKGPNNSLTPGPDDPGSPYAIGSADGGHEAIHRELGTLEDFRRLVAAAGEHGLEIALDFAIQCSPDHPWLKQHPGWFDWRPDGGIKYAENPPKKYQDIVNVDFYKPEAIPDLWLALRDIVLFWVGEGIRLFRVDNPHTKPLPFWQWMIGEVRAANPEVIFLAEAFTRPKVMYRLAKVGFSQSYTYFTWRHTKAEFIDYLTEMTTTAPKDFFRPHFFVNTPDINPPFLQRSGRGGFLIRAALAATLSGLWGVYSGFELLESEPLPGREEYKDSEKYEIRPRPARAPGDIIDEIALLNLIRKAHPALQTHLGVSFLPSPNDNVLVYAKATPSRDDVVVVAVSLDPHAAQETTFELPLTDWGVDDGATLEVEDLVWDARFTWTGRTHHVKLDPDHPYAIWSVTALEPAL